METVSVDIKMEKEEEAEDDDKCFIPKVSCEEIIKHERQEELNHIIICLI